MLTRSKVGITKPRISLSLSATISSLSPIPHTYLQGLADPNKRNAMLLEFSALIKNKTWEPPPPILM